MRLILGSALLLLAAVAVAPAASAETVSIGPCEVDACVVACVDVREPCHDGRLACTVFAFRWVCTPV
jgi:hypothetical protein